MSTERGHADKVLFLSLYERLQTFSMVYFLHKWQNYAFTKLFLFPKSFNGSPISLRKKNRKFFPWFYKALKTWPLPPSCSPTAQDTWRRHLHPVSSALNALLSFVIMAHSLTSFKLLCKCLPFRDDCPSQLSSYPFIILHAIYHNLRICLLYDSFY